MRFEGRDKFRKTRPQRPGHELHMADGRWNIMTRETITETWPLIVERCLTYLRNDDQEGLNNECIFYNTI